MSQVTDTPKVGEKALTITSHVLVALGSNMESETGSPVETLRHAVEELQNSGGVIRAQSPFYATPAMPAGIGPAFVNAALVMETHWAPHEAIMHMHEIEAQMGRRRATRWGERVVDIDLLAIDQKVLPDAATVRAWMQLAPDKQREMMPEQLILPHPRMHERGFVLVPLADVAPDWVHPITRRTVIEMRDALPKADVAAIQAVQ